MSESTTASGRRPGSANCCRCCASGRRRPRTAGRCPPESVKSLAETGFFRLLQPARFGGYEADPVTFLDRGAR